MKYTCKFSSPFCFHKTKTRSNTQYLVVTYNEEESEKEYTYVCVWLRHYAVPPEIDTTLYTHYTSIKKKQKIKKKFFKELSL